MSASMTLLGISLMTCAMGCSKKSSNADQPKEAPPVREQTEKREEPQTIIVFASGEATLFVAPDEKATSVKINTRDVPHALRLVARKGDWVEVETIGEHRGGLYIHNMKAGEGGGVPITCHEDLAGLRAFRLRLFVRSRDLLSVTTRPIRIEHPDGTWAELETGVAVGSASKYGVTSRRVYGRFAFDAVLPEESVGDSFIVTKFTQPEPVRVSSKGLADAGPAPDAGPKQRYVRGHTIATFHDQTIKLMGLSWDQNSIVRGTKVVGDKTLITIGRRCVKLGVLVGSDTLTDEPFRRYLNLRKTEYLDRTEAKKGAVVYWENGDRAGVVHAAINMSASPTDGADRQCFERSLLVVRVPRKNDPVLTLCLDSADLKKDE